MIMEELLIEEGSSRRRVKTWILYIPIILLALIFLSNTIGSAVSSKKLSSIESYLSGVEEGHSLNDGGCPEYTTQYDPFYGGMNGGSQLNNNVSQSTTILKNGTVWVGNGQVFVNTDVVIVKGKISAITKNWSGSQAGATIIQLKGEIVTPGLVDMHSHLGVYSYPEDSFGTQDGNEMTNPTFPQMRALDGLNPNDPAIPHIRSGGVTTSLVLPGSGNIMGGEAAMVKLRDGTIREMLIPDAPRAMKMACGENPKRVYGNRQQTPMSRMGVTYLLRNRFLKAADEWDCQAHAANGKSTGARPFDLDLETLVGVLRGQVLLNVHCYKEEDLEMMVRTSKEFNFKIAAFHHGLEAWRVPDLLQRNNISAAIFTDHWGFKMEGYDGSVHAAKILNDGGVNVALKSDHPVLFAKDLVHEAAKAFHYGLPEQKAFSAVSLNPAKALRLDSRIGSLEVGKEADVVVWPNHPFALGSRPSHVFVDGWLLHTNQNTKKNLKSPTPSTTRLVSTGKTACTPTSRSFYVSGVNVYTMDADQTVLTDATISVVDGSVTCVDKLCPIPSGDIDRYNLPGGVVIPGIVSLDGSTAQQENIRAVDGIVPTIYYQRKIKSAFGGGVTSNIVLPQGNRVLSGVGGFIYTSPGTDEFSVKFPRIISENSSLSSSLGNRAKSGVKSVSQQFAELRAFFQVDLNTSRNTPVGSVLSGAIPLVVDVDQADHISSLLRLKKELNIPRLIIRGGAESHKLKSQLASEGVAVILAPARPKPNEFETWNSREDAVVVLREAGVNVSIAVTDRWAVANGMPYVEALASITSVPAKMFGLNGVGRIRVNETANFALYGGDPLSLSSSVQV
ncbi:amidohydrolase family protein [Planoprotostelium fungivorum]|uniref:Amidohydrolase family protein n=1 Tax=Planoprotostelium fungivorum TaxID=1890364 RepID=A0A2P6NEI6_9EUKA|nr:amidohydrolase family protein [Planoprotostelium fungivorum]